MTDVHMETWRGSHERPATATECSNGLCVPLTAAADDLGTSAYELTPGASEVVGAEAFTSAVLVRYVGYSGV
jgi:hypothetical protein